MKLLSLLLALCLLFGAFVNAEEDNKADTPLCPCPRNMDPVCGSNNVSYQNRCLFDCARRHLERSGRSLQLLRSGNFASTPETLPSKREEANAGGSGGSNSSSAGGGGGGGGSASGGNSGTGVASSGGGGATSGATSVPDNGEQSPTSCDLGANATINGQVAKHGSLTIVRRSNSRKNFTQIDSQTQSIASPSSASISFFQTPLSESLAERLSGRGTNGSSASGSAAADKRSGDYTTATTSTTSGPNSAGKMQPSSPNQTNFATDNSQIARSLERPTYDYRQSRDTIEYPNSIIAGPTGSVLDPSLDHSSDHSVETGSNLSMAGIWETENLPPVDTPDALNKAAIRIRSLLRRMDHETVAYEDMQRNLHYAARVLEAVFIDESSDPVKQRCTDGNCKNLNNNNSSNSSCSLHNKAATEEQSSQSPANASDNQTSIESRTKGVSLAPQTHSGPTGPPTNTADGEVATKTLETVTEESTMATATETTTATATTTTTTAATTTATDANESTTGSGAGQSVSSSSSCSNKATVQRQRRLRTPVWARSMSTNKTYLKNGLLLHKY
ncbi:hypothetical protein ACLKA7_004284 [Drosophila subpalustris]